MAAFDLDTDALCAYLETSIDGFSGPLTAEKFPGGQSNPTYRIDAASGAYVLRRKPPGKLLKSAHAVDREFTVMSALAGSKVPVPTMRILCEDEQVIGSMFYLMDYLDGDIYWNAALPELDPERRSAMYDNMNQLLADLHNVDVEAVGLSGYGKPGNYFARQLDRWTKQYRASETQRLEPVETLISYLEANLPEDDGQVCLVHGDFRLDNMMFAKGGTDIIALLDWELSTLGHPYADLAYQCMQWRLPGSAAIPGLGDVDREALGIPSEKDYVRRYCERRGISAIDDWVFYLAFSFFRLSAILQGVYKRALDGNASNDKAKQLGGMTAPLAQMGVQVVEQGA
ncbi:phosphotransferase family protein [Spongiibacter marinus]|jgi:aminoglycoside phosphotransferase (APT) family kinase protein|uniref:phosphotransferase family protein n=1 Tax=Spongiibacter marinus TaxID=354246 RepID=UPI00195F5290|nr:phosphotransferase family protein [Spongiibacter marinus]MBM7423102.1 aminoglycoside phosphotransferase (APT) family kinase protein [Spongiibacter marinus]